jgi:hypothetical protein
MFHRQHPDELVTNILSQIARERGKPLDKMKYLLLIKKSQPINLRFWQILDAMIPGHTYTYVGCCRECGSLDLC